MTSFNDQLLKIHQKISIKDEERRPYTKMFDTVTNWLMKEMCKVDPAFKKMYKGTSLFGSYPNRVRIMKPSEFDVFILLKFPFPINVRTHYRRPGFVGISTRKWNSYTSDQDEWDIYNEMFVCERFLYRNEVKSWIQNIIEEVLQSSPPPKSYNITYSTCNVAHNIRVQQKGKCLSIDFVPGIMLTEENVVPLLSNAANVKKEYLDKFVAIPKSIGGYKNKIFSPRTFQLVNPAAERDIIWDKQNLKVVYRLLKSLRNRYRLQRLKSYFLTAIFLWKVTKTNSTFWRNSVGDILLEMLHELCDYFESEEMPYYWDSDFNVLTILTADQIERYSAALDKAYDCLTKISEKQSVSYSEVVNHFKTK